MRLILIIISSLLVSATIAEAQDVALFISVRDDCVDSPASPSTLYIVNPSTANSKAIGPIGGFLGVTSLEFLPDGRLVGTANNDGPEQNLRKAIFIEINPDTGAGTLIGEVGDEANDNECGRAPDITYDSATNTLFATGDACTPSSDDFLQTINQMTGKGTSVGTYDPFNGRGNGIAISDNGVIFVTASEEFITVDPLTGNPTKIGDIQISVENDEDVHVNGLAFHPITGELYGTTIDQTETASEKSSKLIILDTGNGNTTIVGDLPDCTDGLVFRIIPRNVPTLSEWGLIAMAGVLGIVGLLVLALRRRKVTA